MHVLFMLLEVSLSKSMFGRVLGWSMNYFRWHAQRKLALCFIDEVDAIGGARFDGELVLSDIICIKLDLGPDTLDPALLRLGRLDHKVESGLSDLKSMTQIFKIHTKTMNCERDICFELLAHLCPNSTGEFFNFSAYVFLLTAICISRGNSAGITEGFSMWR